MSGGPAIAIRHGPGGPYYSNDNRAPTIGGPFTLCNSWPSRATGELRYLTDSWALMATRKYVKYPLDTPLRVYWESIYAFGNSCNGRWDPALSAPLPPEVSTAIKAHPRHSNHFRAR